jgi:large subunit ribosomal protein L17
MRHLKDRRKLNRNATHRLALMRNLTVALLQAPDERIITTVAKAKEARRYIEKLITLAKRANLTDDAAKKLHYRRLIRARLGPMASARLVDDAGNFIDVSGSELAKDDSPVTVLKKLVDTVGKRFKERPGGYTRIVKRLERRLGDAGHTAFLELLKDGETKVRAKAKPVAQAPKVETEEKK